MVITQIVTAFAAAIVLFAAMSKIQAMTADTDNRIRFAQVMMCVAAFYMLTLILGVAYKPTAVESLVFIGYATLQLSCRRDRRRVYRRKSHHETTYN